MPQLHGRAVKEHKYVKDADLKQLHMGIKMEKNADEHNAVTLYAQYVSRDDNGQRKYTWVAHNNKELFNKAFKHVTENGYTPEGPILKLYKGE